MIVFSKVFCHIPGIVHKCAHMCINVQNAMQSSKENDCDTIATRTPRRRPLHTGKQIANRLLKKSTVGRPRVAAKQLSKENDGDASAIGTPRRRVMKV